MRSIHNYHYNMTPRLDTFALWVTAKPYEYPRIVLEHKANIKATVIQYWILEMPWFT